MPTYEVKRLVWNARIRQFCRLPYRGHPHGCPNNGVAHRCPPWAPLVTEYFDLARPLFLVVSEFDLAKHAERMRLKHPGWSERKSRCVLYWQGRARKYLMIGIHHAQKETGALHYTTCPEAMGVNVYATCRLAGVKLERIRDLKICRHVALLGWR